MTQFARPTPAAADYDSTIIGALELSEKKWVLAVQLPGVNRPWEAVRRCWPPLALIGSSQQRTSRAGLANVGDKIVRMLDPDRHANQ